MTDPLPVQRSLITIWAAVAVLSIGVTVRNGCAEWVRRVPTADSLRRAAEIAPCDYRPWEYLAQMENQPGDARQALARNPYRTPARLVLAVAAEYTGDTRLAESEMLAAYQYDRMFLPRWSLANYYFRRQDAERFWHWARATAGFGRDNLGPLYDLCWREDPSGTLPARTLPPTPEYLDWLVAHRKFTAADAVVKAITVSAAIRNAADSAINSGESAYAISWWNRGASAALAASSGSIVNGNFALPISNQGFDWHRNWHPDALLTGRRLEFTGKLAGWDPLWQPVVLESGRRYRLLCRYNATVDGHPAGLHWAVGEQASPSLDLVTDRFAWDFEVTRPGIFRLTLAYARAAGSPLLAGSVILQEVQLLSDMQQ